VICCASCFHTRPSMWTRLDGHSLSTHVLILIRQIWVEVNVQLTKVPCRRLVVVNITHPAAVLWRTTLTTLPINNPRRHGGWMENGVRGGPVQFICILCAKTKSNQTGYGQAPCSLSTATSRYQTIWNEQSVNMLTTVADCCTINTSIAIVRKVCRQLR
jgi:hypothetical protein